MSLNVGTSFLGSGGLRAAAVSILTPAQTLVAAWTAAGCSGIILADDLVAPLSAPGSIVSHLDGITYTAASAAGTPTPQTDGPNGMPYMRANGISQTLIGGTAETVDTYCAVVRVPPPLTTWKYGSIIDGAATFPATLGLLDNHATSFYTGTPPRAVRRNGTLLATPYDCAPVNVWMVLSVSTYGPTLSQICQLLASANAFFAALDLVALVKWSTAPTSDQIAAAEAAASTYTGIALA